MKQNNFYRTFILALVFVFISNISIAQSIERNRLESIIEYLSSDEMEGRETGSIGEKRAGDFIKTIFEYNGIQALPGDDYFQEFRVEKPVDPHQSAGETKVINGRNTMAYINNGGEKTIVIGAHYDHLGYGAEGSLYVGEPMIHNGADDNASGVCGVLELGRRLKDASCKHNFLLLAFSGEEKGLLGSNFFTKHPLVPLEDLAFMVNMDMIGRLNDEKKLAIHGVGTSPIFAETISNTEHDFSLKLEESGSGPSDHASFYYSDIPVLSFFTGQHSDYHKPSDDEIHINYDGLEAIIDFIESLILKLDRETEIPFVKTVDESEALPRFKVTLGVMPDYLFSGKGMRIDGVSAGKTAEAAGLKKGDIVIRMGDIEVVDMMSYMKALGAFEKGDETKVIVKRDEKELKKKVIFK